MCDPSKRQVLTVMNFLWEWQGLLNGCVGSSINDPIRQTSLLTGKQIAESKELVPFDPICGFPIAENRMRVVVETRIEPQLKLGNVSTEGDLAHDGSPFLFFLF